MLNDTICHVIDYGGPTGGSFVPALEALARSVVAQGRRFVVCATHVFGATWPSELEAAGAEVHLIESSAEISTTLKRMKPSIVHAHFTRYDLPVLCAPSSARIFWHVHSHREDFSLAARAKALVKYRILGRRVERLVTVSQMLARECIAFGAPFEWVRAVPNGIDTDRFRPPNSQERQAARASFGIFGDDQVVLFFERVPYKGGTTVYNALEQAQNFRLFVVGGGKVDRDRFSALPRVICRERVADTRQLYWAADVLAFASDNEAFGFVMAEALASRLPIAATDIDIVHEICGPDSEVVFFPVRDANALRHALTKAIELKGGSGRERMIDRFNLDRWTCNILKLYDE